MKSELISFLREASAYLQLRSELFTLEAKEAGQLFRKKTRLYLFSLATLFISHLLILGALIGILGSLLHPQQTLSLANWTGASLILGFLHLIIGLTLLLRSRKITKQQTFFEYTRHELQKEQEWLKHKKKP